MSGLDVAIRCAKCGSLFGHPSDRPQPDQQAYCPRCAVLINRRIQRSLAQRTGRIRGGIALIDGIVAGRQD